MTEMTAADMRASAANLRLLASVYESNAVASHDVGRGDGAVWP